MRAHARALASARPDIAALERAAAVLPDRRHRGLAHGHGVATYPDGTIYEGAFQNGQREGEGTARMPDGFTYSGGWKAGLYHGQGIATYPNGDVVQFVQWMT